MQALHRSAEQALAAMAQGGFEQAQVSLRQTGLTEVNIINDEASLLRSHEKTQLTLLGLTGQRKASTALDIDTLQDSAALQRAVAQLHADAQAAPVDDANAVSSGQQLTLTQGPQQAELELLVDKTRELLDWRARHAPLFRLGEGMVAHRRVQTVTLTSSGSALSSSVGSYAIDAIGAARSGRQASSFCFSGGSCNELRTLDAAEAFGIGAMMTDAVASLDPQPLKNKFSGDLVLSPMAVSSLLEWLLSQLGDERLISHSSIYQARVGQPIAVPAFTLRSRFDGAGVAAVSSDAFVAAPVQAVQQGRLTTLLPSLYGARRTGLPHVPTASGGWSVDAGDTPLAELIAGVRQGALVGRFSMGRPAASGDFSGVIKNGFLIEDGQRGPALAETMVAGNMAQMLQSITAISRERIDSGSVVLPWLRVSGMHFS